MSNNETDTSIARDETGAVDRRAMLQQSILGGAMFGGAALIGAALGGFSGAEAQPAPAAAPAMFRRILTGNNAQGKSYFVEDKMVKANERFVTNPQQPIGPGAPGDLPNLLPSDFPEIEPPVGGTYTYFISFPPSKMSVADARAAFPKGWDRNGTVAHMVPLDNAFTCVLENGETIVNPGDLLVIRNAKHITVNHTDKPVRVLVVKMR